MKNSPILLFVFLFSWALNSCEPQITSTCSECEFFEHEYSERLSIISGFDATELLVEQPYSDWDLQDSIGSPDVIYSDRATSDSAVVLQLTVDTGAGSE